MKKDSYFQTLYIFLLLVVLGFGVYIRFEDVKAWKENKEFFFYKNEPLYSEYDSFYFARYALDLKEGLFKIGEIDNFRFFPDNSSSAKIEDKEIAPKYSLSGTFISYLFYLLSEITGVSVAWLTYYLIPFMAVTVALPLYFYFTSLKLPWVGLIGGITAVSAPMYLGRTGLMRLDHDVFNLTLPFFIAFFFYKFFQTTSTQRKYLWIGLASIFLLFYQLWYGHPNLNFVLVFTFFIAYFWDYLKALILRKEKSLKFTKEDLYFWGILLLPQMWYLWIGPYHLYLQVKTLVFNIKSPTSAELLFKDFPNIFMSISELQKLNFNEAILSVIYSKILGIIGLILVFFLFFFYFRALIFLFPFFGIGLLTFFSGARFAIYLSPFIGLGLGYLGYLISEKAPLYFNLFTEEKKRKLFTFIVGLAFFIATLIVQGNAIRELSSPKIFSSLVKGMEWIKEKTPKNSVIFTWWDYGYAFQLYSRRAVFHDGGTQTTPKTYFVAKAFTTSDPQKGWLITSFLANYGLTGLAKILKEGVPAKEIVKTIEEGKYTQPLKQPIYWVFTEDLISKFGWIHYFGSYNFDKKVGIFGKILAPTCKVIAPNQIQCPDLKDAILDLNAGIITVGNQVIPIKDFHYFDGKELKSKRFFEQGYVIEIVKAPSNETGLFIVEPPGDTSLFNQMFILRKYNPRYFELVYDDFPHMVIYKVKTE